MGKSHWGRDWGLDDIFVSMVVDLIGPGDICSVCIAIQPEFKALASVHDLIAEDTVTMTNTNFVLTNFGPLLVVFVASTEHVQVIVKVALNS